MTTTESRPKRAIVAYCALVDRLTTPGMGAIQSLMPFFAEACIQFAGQLFDAGKFAAAVGERYGIQIPRLAALGFTEHMANERLLIDIAGQGARPVYRFAERKDLIGASSISPISEAEIDSVLASFVKFCRADDALIAIEDEALHEGFLDRLLNIESMRILARKERSVTAKKAVSTLTLTKPSDKADEINAELHLDFITSQFILDLREKNLSEFELVSNIAFASMAAEAIASFHEPISNSSNLSGLVVYIDSPLLLDMLGVNDEYAEYGKELLSTIQASGASAAVLEHCVAEAETAVHAQLAYLRSGINRSSYKWGLSAKPDLLNALLGNVGERAYERLGISVLRDPELNLHRRSSETVGTIEVAMNTRMQAWRNEEAKEHDRKSVWSMLAIRDTSNPCPRICDSKNLLLSRNTALVSIANVAWKQWLKGITKHSSVHIDKWAPVALSDKQFAGYVWARSGSVGTAMPRARLLAHCSAAVRPRADVKAKAYNLVLELNGKLEADDVAALLEDREGARALMRATRGDPEDVTADRLPFILESVKLAAGEFAAARVREENVKTIEELGAAHAIEAQRMATELETARTSYEQDRLEADLALKRNEEERTALAAQNRVLQTALIEATNIESSRITSIYTDGLAAGVKIYRTLRWGAAAAFGSLTGVSAYLSTATPALSTCLTILLGVAGFWFVPDFLQKPLNKISKRALVRAIRRKDKILPIPIASPNFRIAVWKIDDRLIQIPSKTGNETL